MRHSSQVRKLTESQGETNIYCWDETDIVAEQTDGEQIKTYLRGINLIAGEIDSYYTTYIEKNSIHVFPPIVYLFSIHYFIA
ncbi:hypothetical protein [Lacrimispora sp.]|uniref:hypothetical protein n=1 Tax=Lacrimispora sp. TaxID=2719234 RepID=UPI0028984A49|nr:hypothetical protein [Lacrimispora sp.]